MELPEKYDRTRSDINPGRTIVAGKGTARRSIRWLSIVSFLLFAAIVMGFIWHDLRRARNDTLAYWNALLTNTVNGRIGMATLWLDERSADMRDVATSPLTFDLLSGERKRANATTLRDFDRSLTKIIQTKGLLAAVVVDANCNVVAKVGLATETNSDFGPTCEWVFRTEGYEAIASGLQEGRFRVNLALPVFAANQPSNPARSGRSVVGAVILVADPIKRILPFLLPTSEFTRTSDTMLAWRNEGRAVVYSLHRNARGKEALIEIPLNEVCFETRLARGHEVGFGEYTDYRGIKVLAVGKRIIASGDNIACKIDSSEALAEYHRRAGLESLAGLLSILVVGLVMVTWQRGVAAQELIEQLRQQQALLELQQQAEVSEARYRELFENANDAIVTFDLDGTITSLNKAAERLSGYSKDEALQKNIFETFPPPHQQTAPQVLERLLSGGGFAAMEWEILAKDGRHVAVEASGQVIYQRGRSVGFQVIARDISERKRAEEQLRKLSEAVEQSPACVVITDTRGCIEYVNPKFTRLTGYTLEEAVGKNPSILKSGETQPEEYRELWETIASGREWRGVFHNKKKNGELYWESASITPIKNAAGAITHFLAVKEDVTARRQAEEALRESEERFRRLTEASSEGIGIHDRGKIIDASPRLAEMLGYDLQELIGARMSDLVAPESLELVMDHIRSNSEEPYKHLARRKDGSIFPVEVRARALPWKGGQVRVAAIADITERTRAEEAIKAEKAFSEAVIDSLPGFVYVIDPKGEVIRWNRNAQTILGYSREELVTLQTLDVITEEDRENVASKWLEAFAQGSANCEARVLTKDGRKVPFLLSAIRADIGNKTYIIGTGIDISERKNAEEALKESEARYRSLVEDSLALISTHALDGTLLSVNPAAAAAWGGAPKELVGRRVQDILTPSARHLFAGYLERIRAKGSDEGLLHVVTKAGEERYWTYRNVLRQESGKEPFVLGYAHDITERKRAEEALQREKAFSDAVIDSLPGAFYVTDDSGRMIRWNKQLEKMLGYSSEELCGLGPQAMIAEEDRAFAVTKRQEALDQGLAMAEAHAVTKDRKRIPLLLTGRRAVIGDSTYVVGMGIDITDRKRAEEALRHQEKLFRAIVEDQTEMIVRWKPDGTRTFVNQAYCRTFGGLQGELVGTSFFPFLAEEDRARIQQKIASLTPDQPTATDIHSSPRRDGSMGWHEWTDRALFGGEGSLVELQSVGRDITEHRRAEIALRESEQRYRDFITHSTEGVWRAEFEHPIPLDLPAEEAMQKVLQLGYIAECNDAMARVFGHAKREHITGKHLGEFQRDANDQWLDSIQSGLAGGWKNRTVEYRTFDKHRNMLVLQRTEIPIIENGKLVRIWGMTRDVTEMRRTEDALRASEERYRLLFERSLAGVVRTTLDGRVLECNEAFARIQGYDSREEILSANVKDFYLEKSDGTALIDLLKERPIVIGQEFHTRRRDGTAAWVMVSGSLIQDEKEGFTILATAFDITQWKELGEQLRQSQKMEAVGRLAGGVAHDFNNMLQIINGYSELVIDQLPAQDDLRSSVQEIKNVVERAAGLTRQLLAFSRQQVLAPQVLDLNVAIANLSKMLRRLIGEDIELVITEGRPLGRVKADPGQIDQVILNLAVNARDAMPRGGKLAIATSNIEIDADYALAHYPMTPGPYVMIAVSDTGHGMDEETQARIFEPFFTTKEKGKGTGLGLATVYGIIKQSGGFIWVESESGKGTTFRILLPPARDAVVAQEVEAVPARTRGSETILLVEDEEYVRSLVRRSLRSKGYEVLEASNGQEALRVAQQHEGPIHLLITDVVMPGMSGRELAERLASLRPNTETLYMSGYADDAILHHGVLESGAALLQKPFTAEALANKIRHVLDRS